MWISNDSTIFPNENSLVDQQTPNIHSASGLKRNCKNQGGWRSAPVPLCKFRSLRILYPVIDNQPRIFILHQAYTINFLFIVCYV